MGEAVKSALEATATALNELPRWAKAGIGIVVVAIGYPIARSMQAKRKSPWKEDWKEGVVYLYQFPRTASLPNLSPFCIKLETWLRMADIPYENVECPIWLRSKEGLMPFVELDGKELHDSNFIAQELLKRFKKEGTESHLTAEQRGAARALGQMVENTTTQSYALVRYGEHAGELFGEKVLGKRLYEQIPLALKLFSPPWLMKRMVRKRLEAHGIGRHSREEVIGIGLEDLDAISAYLGDKAFITGSKPIRADATLFGLLSQLIWVPIDSPHSTHLKEKCANVVKYAERIKDTYWPDWDETCATGNLQTDWRNPSKFKAAPNTAGASAKLS